MTNFQKKHAGLLDIPRSQLATGIWYRTNKSTFPVLRPEVRDLILSNLHKFVSEDDIQQVVILGSITGYKYTETTDVDVNVIVTSHRDEYQALRKEFNEIPAYGTRHPVNYFILAAQPVRSSGTRKPLSAAETWQDSFFGVYDLKADQWIILPPGPETLRVPVDQFPLEIQIAKHLSNHFNRLATAFNEDWISMKALRNKPLKAFSYPFLKAWALRKKQNELREDILKLVDFAHSVESNRKFIYRQGWGVPRLAFKNLLYKFLEKSEHGHLFHTLLAIKKKPLQAISQQFNKIARVNLVAKKQNGKIIISQSSFDYLLSCLDNQKFINDINADATTGDYKSIIRQNQKAIDVFNRKCRKVLHEPEKEKNVKRATPKDR